MTSKIETTPIAATDVAALLGEAVVQRVLSDPDTRLVRDSAQLDRILGVVLMGRLRELVTEEVGKLLAVVVEGNSNAPTE